MNGNIETRTGPELVAGTNYALHFEGLRDTSGNALQPEDRMLSVADPESFEIIADTSAPVLLAVMDGNDGIYLLFDEAVQSAGGALASAVEIRRQGNLVQGETERVNSRVLKWHSTSTDLGGGFLLLAQYSLSVVGVEDLAGNPADASAMSFTHLAGAEGQLLIARQAPTESYPMAGSAYGLTTLFQGRTWHSDLGMYYYRARWYLPDGGVFGERDPAGYGVSAGLYDVLNGDSANRVDPFGLLSAHIIKGQDPYTCDKLRVEVDGRVYLVSPQSGVVKDEETGRWLDPNDPRAKAARQASGWDFGNAGLDGLISALANQTAFLQNRWTVGISFQVASTFCGSGFSPHNGWLYGVNIQYWLNRKNQGVAAVYGIESLTPVGDRNANAPNPVARATDNVHGVVLGGGFSGDVAVYNSPSMPYAPFNMMSDLEIVNTWGGGFQERGVMTPFSLIGGSGFTSTGGSDQKGSYDGVSWALSGAGAGYFSANTKFHLLDGPYNPFSFLAFVQGQIAAKDLEIPAGAKDAIVTLSSWIESKRRLQ